ncbi:hypothetical protein niasHS_010832 [Heterodera schachtii]|uniref:SUMO-activating enzyme subunit 1 n=1 Tax=Heterodera schachtii TaxID=97005 RepID=A0ABD2IYU2_HETSC
MKENGKHCDDVKDSTNMTADYEKMFTKRFTDSDADYIMALKIVDIEPICISPWKSCEHRQNIVENGRFYEAQRFSRGGRGRFYNRSSGNFRDENFGRRRGGNYNQSNDETQIYDRQIRLWGMEAQNRLRNSSVLLVGLSGLGAEIAKNLMLSGLKSLTIMDNKEVVEGDYASNFLLVRAIKTNRAEASAENLKLLNPMVELMVLSDSVVGMPSNFFSKFDLVIVVDQDYDTTNLINKKCRQNKIRFEAASVFGWVGYAFFDFNNHTFLIPKPKEKETIIESILDGDEEDGETGGGRGTCGVPNKMKMNGIEEGRGHCGDSHQTLTIGDEEDSKVKKNIPFPSFEHTFAIELGTKRFRRKFNIPSTYFVVRAFFALMREKSESKTHEEVADQWRKELSNIGFDESKQKITAEDFQLFVCSALNPVCSIVGSVVAQEAIKSLSQNDEPLKNAFFYSALESCGTVVDMAV